MQRDRRRFFSFLFNEPAHQHFLLLQFFVVGTIMAFILYNHFLQLSRFSESVRDLMVTPAELKLRLNALYQSVLTKLFIVSLLGFLVNALLSLIFLERITGPLRQATHALDNLGEGRFPERSVQFRGGDLTPELAIMLNRFFQHVKRRMKNISSFERKV
ncbi:MAG: hypothetical protein A3J52_03980 [Omnitrophica bacterium RIFCSPHIGHO2_02_FULL_49_9]|nr:MAG: hypothetical protein A3J52_03980 [Omnitrophica bacterium RIFCSPHIGHO2_02_FULL_49_9]